MLKQAQKFFFLGDGFLRRVWAETVTPDQCEKLTLDCLCSNFSSCFTGMAILMRDPECYGHLPASLPLREVLPLLVFTCPDGLFPHHQDDDDDD